MVQDIYYEYHINHRALKILNLGDCQKKAREIRGDRGYEVISQDTDSNASGNASAAGGGDTIIGTSI